MYYLPDIMTRSLDESRKNLEAAISEIRNANRTKYFFAIEHGETGAFIQEAEYKSFTWHDGRMKDRVEYRLLNDEWKTVQNISSSNFWQAIDKLVAESEIIIDRPKDSAHPRYLH
jgi:hypothetical protein